MKNGYFISFEGGDGSGKSTQISRLKKYLEDVGREVVLTREPGGTYIGEKIRQIILDPSNEKMTPVAEAMLYAASRAQHVEEIIKPAIAEGKIVISDRFIDSSLAYQGHARGLGECVNIINHYAVNGCMPNITFLLKLRPQIGNNRIKNREKDRIELEAESFHAAVYAGYEILEKAYPDRIISIDAEKPIDEITEQIIEQINSLLSE